MTMSEQSWYVTALGILSPWDHDPLDDLHNPVTGWMERCRPWNWERDHNPRCKCSSDSIEAAIGHMK